MLNRTVARVCLAVVSAAVIAVTVAGVCGGAYIASPLIDTLEGRRYSEFDALGVMVACFVSLLFAPVIAGVRAIGPSRPAGVPRGTLLLIIVVPALLSGALAFWLGGGWMWGAIIWLGSVSGGVAGSELSVMALRPSEPAVAISENRSEAVEAIEEPLSSAADRLKCAIVWTAATAAVASVLYFGTPMLGLRLKDVLAAVVWVGGIVGIHQRYRSAQMTGVVVASAVLYMLAAHRILGWGPFELPGW